MTPREREDAALAELTSRSAQLEKGRIESYGPHPDQIVEWHGPNEPGAAPVMFIHGGFFRPAIDRSHARLTAATLAAATQTPVALAGYRRIPGDPAAGIADIGAIADRLEPAIWVGHSAGGTLVLLRALDRRRPGVRVVALAPIVDVQRGLAERLGDGALEDWLGPPIAAEPSTYAPFNPVELVAALPERLETVRCLHGAGDLTVPASQSSHSGVPHLIVPAAHHLDLIDPASDAWPTVVATIQAMRAPTR